MASKRSSTSRELGDAEYQRLAQFRYALRQFLHFSDDAARQAGLNPQQYQLLVLVRGFTPGEEPTVGAVAKRLLIKHHSAVGLVDRLEAEGLLVRKRDGIDGRKVTLALTGKAETVLNLLVGAHRKELRRLVPLMKPLLAELGL
ncbi:MAG TPA: MarR family winged helix-turn-helix transcriptional regulator [Rhizomicrobium sp.]|jgi:DNA-binding MarR family transcriptional regulator